MMPGFSDREPDDWDMAVGTVRGFRWWTMTVPMVPLSGHSALGPYFPVTEPEPWIPDIADRCTVQGMHGGQWRRGRGQDNGRYKAQCKSPASLGLLPLRYPDLLNPGCGCGFWAYWRDLPSEWDACLPYVRLTGAYGFQRGGYSLSLPVAGVIEGSGKTVIGERGFRCEYARITDLTFNVNTDCMFYDESRLESWLMSDYSYSASQAGPVIRNPRNAGDFTLFAERELHIEAAVLMSTVKGSAQNILGDGINWHADVAALLESCPPDRNYA